jgi:uncharacterized tellurite resistance protein B-like protein
LLKKFSSLFAKASEDEQSKDSGNITHDELHLAAAVLMVEAIHIDGEADAQEIAVVKRVLAQHFSLEDDHSNDLFEMAQDHHTDSVHMHRYTKTIKDRFSEEERVELIELLWEVVYADGELHALESNLLRRVGGLIYVSDRDRGDARKRVIKRLSAGQ